MFSLKTFRKSERSCWCNHFDTRGMGFSYWQKFMIRQLSTSWQYLVWVSNIYHQHQLTDYYKVISLSWGVFIHISLLSKPSKIKLKSKKNMITSTNRTHAKSDLSAADFLEGSHLKSSDDCSAAWGWFFFYWVPETAQSDCEKYDSFIQRYR